MDRAPARPLKRAAHRLLYRIGARSADGVVAVSDEVAASFARRTGARRDRVTVIENGVDVDRFPPPGVDRDAVRAELGFGPRDRLLTCVASFKEQKGHAVLVDAAAKVLPAWPDAHVLLVGDGALRSSIAAQVAAAGLDGRVHLLGNRRDVAAILAASDGFVLPSRWEGFSVALAEAMASGLPVVATAVSGTTQVMRDGETGWLVPPGDAGGARRRDGGAAGRPGGSGGEGSGRARAGGGAVRRARPGGAVRGAVRGPPPERRPGGGGAVTNPVPRGHELLGVPLAHAARPRGGAAAEPRVHAREPGAAVTRRPSGPRRPIPRGSRTCGRSASSSGT